MDIQVTKDKIVIQMLSDLTANVVKDNIKRAEDYIDKDNSGAVILDLSNVENIDSIGITFIVGLYKTSSGQERDFKVIGANDHITNLFHLMSLDEVFPIE